MQILRLGKINLIFIIFVIVLNILIHLVFRLPGAIYLDTAAQKSLKYRIHKFLPYDSYTRKAIGYLYAIEVSVSHYSTMMDMLLCNA